ncbi:MAG: hypothetical protein ACRDE8_11415, partial [Ginsengibacter sp.]
AKIFIQQINDASAADPGHPDGYAAVGTDLSTKVEENMIDKEIDKTNEEIKIDGRQIIGLQNLAIVLNKYIISGNNLDSQKRNITLPKSSVHPYEPN